MNTLLDVFKSFHKQGNRTAIVYRTGVRRFTYSYRDLVTLSMKMAHWLDKKGIKKGDRITLWAPNGPGWAVTFWASAIRGIIVVPVDFSSNRERAEKIASITESKLILQSQYKLDRIDSPLAFLIENLPEELERETASNFYNDISGEDIVELIYTSGTTGNPKGVVLTHKNICANLEQVRNHIRITEDYNFLSLLPLSHMFEQTGGFLTPLSSGGRIVYVLTLKPSSILEAFAEENIYAAVIVPRLLQVLKNSIERELEEKRIKPVFDYLTSKSESWSNSRKKFFFYPIRRKFGKNLQFFVSGGSALDPEVGRFWGKIGFPVVEGYGLTECSPVLTANTREKQVLGSVGKPLAGVSIRITDGEIQAYGPNIFPGYWNDKEVTQATFSEDGWFKTGDLGEIDKDGYLFIKGRKKDMILAGNGMNVYPEDVEGVLNKTPGVKESCVIGVKSKHGEEVHAVLILDGSGKSPEEIIKTANISLDEHQQIRGFSVWPEQEFPKTTTLKIQKFKVKQSISKGSSQALARSFDELQGTIAQITGKPVENVAESALLVSDLGLSSLARLELVTCIEQKYRLDLDDSLINQETTVGSLRKIIEKRERTKSGNIFWFWTNSKWANVLRMIRDLALYPFYRIVAPTKVEGLEKINNLDGPIIFISNHLSFIDQPIIMYALPRRHRYNTATAAWQEFFFDQNKNLITRWWKKFVFLYAAVMRNVFPLPQSSGFRKTLAYMGKLIDHKINFLIFPEGQISLDGKISPFMKGLGLMVKELKAPVVVPIHISGPDKVLPRGKKIPQRNPVRVAFGDPLYFYKESPDEILKKCQEAVIALSSSN